MIYNKYHSFISGCLLFFITDWVSAQTPNNPIPTSPVETTATNIPVIWTKAKLIEQLSLIETEEKRQADRIKVLVDSLRQKNTGYPVIGPTGDTLLVIWQKNGELSAQQRAQHITQMVESLKQDQSLIPDSIRVDTWVATTDVMYRDKIIVSFTEPDMMWYNESRSDLANNFRTKLVASLTHEKVKVGWLTYLIRISLVILVLAVLFFLLRLISRVYFKSLELIDKYKDKFLRDLSYKGYTVLSKEKELNVILTTNKVLRWAVVIFSIYLSLPLLFSIFPFTQDWAEKLFTFVWNPLKTVSFAVIRYIPNLFSIFVIYYVMTYFIKSVEFVFNEIDEEKLKFTGFHADWALPTYNIVKFVLYAFMFVLIFPYLPGSDSGIFQGVTVFLGVLFSLGSSTAISNVIAGMVITYMRPYKIGDIIKVQDAEGEVIEKTMLITRLKTSSNEIVTIPNSSILTSNTTNFTSGTEGEGLIIFTTIKVSHTINGQQVCDALIEAARKVHSVIAEPKPFVLQSIIQDDIVTYQINAYCKDAKNISEVQSELIQNIRIEFEKNHIPLPVPEFKLRAGIL